MLEDLLALKSMPSPVLATVSLEVQLRTALSWVVGELKQPLAAPIFPVSKEVVRSQNRPWMFGHMAKHSGWISWSGICYSCVAKDHGIFYWLLCARWWRQFRLSLYVNWENCRGWRWHRFWTIQKLCYLRRDEIATLSVASSRLHSSLNTNTS